MLTMMLLVVGIILFTSIAPLMMADATTPVTLRPRTALSTGLNALKGRNFRAEKGEHFTKLADKLEEGFVDDVIEKGDDAATVDTAATTGDFWIDLQLLILTLTRRATVDPDGLNIESKQYPIGDIWVLTGAIAGFNLTRFETLTEGGGGGTSTLLFAADLTIGSARIAIVRKLAGADPGAGDFVFTGGSSGGTLDTVDITGVANNSPGIAGRLKTGSTGAAFAAQTSVPVSYQCEGTKPTA